ncbi:MAG: hypothetical protein AB1782_13525 [Cyanobacteriota bacterium]
MVRYETFKQFSDRTSQSLSSVYRAARKGKLKITEINGINHVIVEDNQNSVDDNFVTFNTGDSNDKKFENVSEKPDKIYKEAEIIEESSNIRYELQVFQSSINTIEEMANKIEAAKDETILTLKQNNEKLQKNIDNLNFVIETLSADNNKLRTQLAVRETEKNIGDKKIEELDKIINDKDKEIDKLNDKITKLEENTHHQKRSLTIWDKINEPKRL